ncbi:hypothetical protein GQ53DRAFT_868247 [Thozetella sp. PMI_491]|nr:hypothetical protein GQ53DRAFT_868247 [Thozetella sp. PMI_491]
MFTLTGKAAVLATLHYLYPIVIFIYYIITTLITIVTLKVEAAPNKHRCLIAALLFPVVISYLGQFLTLIIHSMIEWRFIGDADTIICLLLCTLVFGVEFISLLRRESPVWYPYIGSFGLGVLFDLAIQAVLYLTRAVNESFTLYEIIDRAIVAGRLFCLLVAVTIYFTAAPTNEDGTEPERHSLLVSKEQTGGVAGYGATSGPGTEESNGAKNSSLAQPNESDESDESDWERYKRESGDRMAQKLKESGNWFTYLKRFTVFCDYIWPIHNRHLQLRMVLAGLCLFAKTAVAFLLPRQIGITIDSLSGFNNLNPWAQITVYIILRLLASSAGLSFLYQWLWMPLNYFTASAISEGAYKHILELSSDFHDNIRSSDLETAIQYGQSISNLLETICFTAIPMLINVVTAFTYLLIILGPYEYLIITTTAVIFWAVSTCMLPTLREVQREEIRAHFEERHACQAGIQGWITVVSFNQVSHEVLRYSTAVLKRIAKSQKLHRYALFTSTFQTLAFLFGLYCSAFLAAYRINIGKATPGDFSMLITYWAQVSSPMQFYASLGKKISQGLVEAERLLEILLAKPSVYSKEGTKPLKLTSGKVCFKHVFFSYDKKHEILKDINLDVAPGTTIAFVGTTGAGKSTILKLLDRFYDVGQGSIEIDGQDIRDVDVSSLRAHIGIVPQNPIFFDDTIINNIRYAKLDATDDEVFEACKAASIHEHILTFTNGYQTYVGERGRKLSGGELQRIAIARAILKKPAIVLLDEATSAVDTETEQKIQEALTRLCYHRTTFIVAHRLSTIMNADLIVVISGGEVIEEGNHASLIRAGGKYADLWSKQAFTTPKTLTRVESTPNLKFCETEEQTAA